MRLTVSIKIALSVTDDAIVGIVLPVSLSYLCAGMEKQQSSCHFLKAFILYLTSSQIREYILVNVSDKRLFSFFLFLNQGHKLKKAIFFFLQLQRHKSLCASKEEIGILRLH